MTFWKIRIETAYNVLWEFLFNEILNCGFVHFRYHSNNKQSLVPVLIKIEIYF